MAERQRILELVNQGVVSTNEGLDLLEGLQKNGEQEGQEGQEEQNEQKNQSSEASQSDGDSSPFKTIFKTGKNLINTLIKMVKKGNMQNIFTIIKNVIILLVKMLVNIIKEAVQKLIQTFKEIKEKIQASFENLLESAQKMAEESQ